MAKVLRAYDHGDLKEGRSGWDPSWQMGPGSRRGPKTFVPGVPGVPDPDRYSIRESWWRGRGPSNTVGSYNRGAPRAGSVGVEHCVGKCLPNGGGRGEGCLEIASPARAGVARDESGVAGGGAYPGDIVTAYAYCPVGSKALAPGAPRACHRKARPCLPARANGSVP